MNIYLIMFYSLLTKGVNPLAIKLILCGLYENLSLSDHLELGQMFIQ